MKILKIEDGKGHFFDQKKKTWSPIDEIDKSALLGLLDIFIGNEVELDEYDVQKIQNQAQQIIYKSIYEKIIELLENKSKFKDEADRMYLEQIKKYQQ